MIALRPLPDVVVADVPVVTKTSRVRNIEILVHEIGARAAWYATDDPWPTWFRYVSWKQTARHEQLVLIGEV